MSSSLSQSKASIPINITAASVSPTPNSASSSFKNVLFNELQVTISSAKLASKDSSPSQAPDVYVELYVDDSPVHKTECVKSSFSPKWDTQFPVLITPYSKLTFKVFYRNSQATATKDNLLGDNSIHLYDTLKRLNGKIDNLSMPLILDKVTSLATSTSQLTLDESPEDAQLIDVNKPNYLFIKLTGLEIDMSQYPPKSRSTSPNVIVAGDASSNSDKSKNKSNEKHSTRSLPRLFRGNKQSNNASSSTTATTNNPSSVNSTTDNASAPTTDQNDGISNRISNGFQSTLPRWSLDDPNSAGAPYPRQQPTVPQATSPGSAASGAPAVSANTAPAVHYSNTPAAAQYPFPVQSNSSPAPTTFTITNNSTQVQPATITTTEFHEELPQGWEIRYDCFGRKYYVDHNTRSTCWELPQQMEVLPPGWEIRRDARGRVYYVDHNTRSTTWQRPTAENMRNYQHWQRQQSQVMQQCDQRFLYPTQSNNNQAANVNPNQVMQYQVLTQQHLNPQQINSNLNKNLAPSTSGQAASSSTVLSSSQVEHDESGNVLGPLPEGWEKRYDQNRRPYFVNHKNKVTQWVDPRIQGEEIETPLPPGWEMKTTQDGSKYFIDHNTKSTTLQDPRSSGPKGAYGVSANNERSFRHKLTQFRYLCHFNALPSHIKINVSRTNIFEDSFHQIMRVPPHELRRRLFITFRGEEGLDYGGISREWFFLLSHEVLNPMYCLFEYAGKNNSNYSLQINPASGVNPDHLLYFKFIGRFIAMALFHGKFIYSGFTLPFYKRMLGKTLIMKDIESIDPEFYNSLVWIKENNIEECGLELYFSVDFEVLGKLTSHELKEGGSEIRVDESNKHEYLRLMSDWRFSRGQEEQTKAFLDGFNEVLPLEWLKYFDERELELLLCGFQEIDIEDWQRNTIYRHYARNSKQIQWFWHFVKEVDSEKRARLLQFVTGTCRVPVGGFAELMGSNGPQRFCIERVGKDNWLPRSHTCFNRLDLPPYKNYEQLAEKLSFAIEETEGFSQE